MSRLRSLAGRAKHEMLRHVKPDDGGFQHRTRGIPPSLNIGDKLLDVGFGNGAFLQVASWLGYHPIGIDFDEEVVDNARRKGFEAYKREIPGTGFDRDLFSHITMSNVLEHLPDPLSALEEAKAILKPGGRLWLTQPNLAANGAKLYGKYWRGYEAPRHLVLWEAGDLARVLSQAGFVEVRIMGPDRTAQGFYYLESELQMMGLVPSRSPKEAIKAALIRVSEKQSLVPVETLAAESVTISAVKPSTINNP